MSRLMLAAAVVPFLLAANGVSLLAAGPDASAPLSQADVQRIVQQGAGPLKQTCWRPDGGGPTSVDIPFHFVSN